MKKTLLFLLSKEKTLASIAIVLSWYSAYRDFLDLEKARLNAEERGLGDVDIYSPHGLKMVIVLLGFIFFLVCTSINFRSINKVATLALIFPLGVFFSWYLTSFEALKNPHLGWLAKQNKLGLLGADWGHIVLLCISLTLLVTKILKACFIPSQTKSLNLPNPSSAK